MSIHPQIIEKDGKKEFVVLPYEEFVAMQEALEVTKELTIKGAAAARDEPSGLTPG